MAAFNVVRVRAKAGQEEALLDIHRNRDLHPGMRSLNLVKTGEREYLFIGEWDSMDAIVAARPRMKTNLEELRPLLEDLGGDLGVTDPRSGEAVVSRTG